MAKGESLGGFDVFKQTRKLAVRMTNPGFVVEVEFTVVLPKPRLMTFFFFYHRREINRSFVFFASQDDACFVCQIQIHRRISETLLCQPFESHQPYVFVVDTSARTLYPCL